MMDAQSNRGSMGQLSTGSAIGGGMHHSLSTPAGVDGGGSNRTPPPTPKKGGKMLAMRVQMLDDTITIFQVQAKAIGKVLFEQVCKQLHLLEADYFGLEYTDTGEQSDDETFIFNHHLFVFQYWLDLQKPLSRQLGLSLVDPLLYFCVKFYTPDPGQLEEEFTRYLFCLQVKRDLAQGVMQCNENTAALMASYIVQAECGDYVSEDYPDHTYLSTYKFIPTQDHGMERKIMENHKKHSGQSPAEADLNLLETARRCEFYGIKMHPGKDHENIPLNLAVAHMGILVFQNYTKINTFSWAKIRKISFKRKRFLIKLHPEGYGFYKDTVDFFFEGRNECKNFWKKCVENHGFFRCSTVKYVSRHKTRVLSRGSSFRYSGKTQKQIIEFVRDNYVKRQTFQRSASFRHSSAHSSATNMHPVTVGNSISAHPLLPLGDTNLSVEAAKLSASRGSTGWSAAATPAQVSPTTKSAFRPRITPTTWNSDRVVNSVGPEGPTGTRPPVPPRMMSSPSPPPTTRSPSPETSVTTSPISRADIEVPEITEAMDVRNPQYPPLPDVHEAAVHRADTGIIHIPITATKMPSSALVKSEGSLDQTTIFTNQCPSQTQSQNDVDTRKYSAQTYMQPNSEYTYKITNKPKRLTQRSASCKDLYDFSFEETGQAKRRIKPNRQTETVTDSLERKLESPITRYDEHKLMYSTNSRDNLEIHQDIIITDQKVYSSSYPGMTAYSQDSMEDPGNYDLRDSQEDISHDSYELLERSDDDYSNTDDFKFKQKKINTRSCSLDSGNYLPSDTDSEGVGRIKCKSSSDVHQDIFLMDDPRDLPRETVPRKSDGSFYKAFKQSSRTSSLESKSDYYESRTSKSSRESLKKGSREKSIGSRTSSQESRSGHESKKPIRRNKSADNIEFHRQHESMDSRTSSVESRSEYYDANSKSEDKFCKHEYDRKIAFERNYGTQKPKVTQEHKVIIESTHVHSMTLQNVETEQNIRASRSSESTTTPTQSNVTPKQKTTHIWPENIHGIPTEITDWSSSKPSTDKSTDSESNIFSFDEDKIQSIKNIDNAYRVVPDLNLKASNKNGFKDVFVEIEPRKCREPIQFHQPIERTKSDPNSLARQRLNSCSRRLLLMHQKSIDLTPAESSDEDYLYKQIPSAPPIMKYRETQFEMPSAEFGHFDILKREIEGQKIKFEVPKGQFEELGAKTQSDFINLPPKTDDIPYVLHKRHIINGTPNVVNGELLSCPKSPKVTDDNISRSKPKSPVKKETETSFLFTQNIDLSKVDPVTLEIDKTEKPIQHLSSPKRDITHIDPVLLETLNSKLSQIESDSPNSSKTESLKPQQKINFQKEITKKQEAKLKVEEVVDTNILKGEPKQETKKQVTKEKLKLVSKSKRVIKPRMQPGKGKVSKTNKTKVRITSFSSDDESLDSDDVFGSAEATPTRIEFSPPQMRKEMESILKFESERKYLQYTMSSTEVEGSPPQTRKKTDKSSENGLDPIQTELRRISERSISIPSSEDDLNIKTTDMQPVFADPIVDGLSTVQELDDKSIDETIRDQTLTEDLVKTRVYEEEQQKEKLLLQAEIENDIKNLRVPSRTKITEIMSPSMRKKGQSSLLFAHARLNLSEGSAFSMLQKQQATESPLPGRRAISLDAPIIPVNRLPPLNAFSSKDDTVEDENQDMLEATDVTESEPEITKPTLPHETVLKVEKTDDKSEGKEDSPTLVVPDAASKVEQDQTVPDMSSKGRKSQKLTVHTKPLPKIRPKTISTQRIPKEDPTKSKSKPTPPIRTTSKQVKPTSVPILSKPLAKSNDSGPSLEKITVESQKTLPSEASLTLPEIKRTKSQEMESAKKNFQKDRARSLEKLELKRMGSKERTKSQEESDTDISKRREKQQMLYETAIKQTKTLKSPVKDTLPVFPQVEETVRERHGKLEISINTIENTAAPIEEAIIITKSPKRLDKKIDKFTKSLELNLTDSEIDNWKMQRLGTSLDLDNRPKSDSEFDFSSMTNEEQTKPIDKSQETKEAEETQDKIVLEGTSLDVWLSVDGEQKEVHKNLENVTVIKKSDEFFHGGISKKPPDIFRTDNASSSDSQSIDKGSIGNSLDIKYIDDSADSSNRSEKDTQLASELRKASETVGKFIRKKLEKKRNIDSKPDLVKDVMMKASTESLTEVSEMKIEGQDLDKNYLSVEHTQRDALLKLSIERSRSEDTGSWMTMECEEFAGTESSFDYEAESSPEKNLQEKDASIDKLKDTLQVKSLKMDLLKRSSDQSRSSDTTGSWTSGEKELSPSNIKETDESSVSCSMGRVVGLSQPELFAKRDKVSSDGELPKSPRSPRSPRMSVLGRTFTMDEGSQKDDKSSSDEAYEIPRDLPPIQENIFQIANKSKKPYPFEEKWSNDSELAQKLHQKISKKLSSADKGSCSSVDESYADIKRNGKGNKHSLYSIEKLSTESRTSLDTESSSGSFGAAAKLQKSGDIPRELSSTWKPFPLDSSGSESLDDVLLPTDQDFDKKEYFFSRENSGDFVQVSDICKMDDVTPTQDDTELPEDLANFANNFNNYQNLTSNLQEAVGINLQTVQTGFLSRTLSRISERSTNSEKSSLEDESTKASTHSGSLNDESISSSNPQVSFSSESPSNAHHSGKGKKHMSEEKKEVTTKNEIEQIPNINNLLQRQISDDRRTSAEMAELSMDDIEIITSERGLKLRRQGSDDTVIDEECFESENKEEEKRGSSSQESEEWPLPEIPKVGQQKLMALHDVPSSDTSQQTTQVFQLARQTIPKSFGLKGSFSLKSQDSEQWPSPPSSAVEPLLEGRVELYYVTPAEEAYTVTVDSLSKSTQEESNSDNENKTIEDTEKTHTYENVATEHISGSLSESLSAEISGVKIVVLQKSGSSAGSNSDDENISNLNDDVFVDASEGPPKHELRPPTALRRSTTSDESSHSSRKDVKKTSTPGSYSEEECTSSMGTNLEDGTVRYALKPTKCTHSSHSEDTSIALSLSEWSNSTTTVKFQNLSSNSGTTKSSSGLKSEENSLTDIGQSISEWSNSNSNTLKVHHTAQFQKLSSTSASEATLTDLIPSFSERTTSESKSLITQQYFPKTGLMNLGSLEESEPDYQKSHSDSQIMHTEDLAGLLRVVTSPSEGKYFTKSTERPMKIPVLSDTEKSSSSEQKTVHTQRYDKDKQKYIQKYTPKTVDKTFKASMKLSKCSPYYSSSLSSESTPLASTSPVTLNKTATVPLTRIHRKPISKSLFQAKSPPSENDSTSSLESPKSKSDRDRRGYRRRKIQGQRKHKSDKAQSVDEYIYVEHDSNCSEYNEYLRNKNMEEMAANFQYEDVLSDNPQLVHYTDVLEEGYYPDVDSQSGSDIFRMEKEDDEKFEIVEGFDLSLIPPPLLEDDFEDEQQNI
ncbi:hypothetical protein WA026_001053 [Henosepilachna vigintioctopunctata]|uniref:FERM domain-containing protein n=1 Tax=Henosepilachna vigintioctopunctata TaxID=420089 RepID=A0AAW1V775_9CUCU